MNRRDSLKLIGLTTLSSGLLLDACKTENKTTATQTIGDEVDKTGRQDYEVEREVGLKKEKFFNEHEMATITVLGDIIIPRDDVSGSASDAKVPEFIEFIVKDIPEHKIPMRGGLKWLDLQSYNRYQKAFVDCAENQQLELVEEIAYPEKAKPEMLQGVAFFNRMRMLTASGFFSSEMGIKDVGYKGNTPGRWEGVPADVLAQYGLKSNV
jgi:hypothetical protein